VIVRPSVVYGPGDLGNVPRMVYAIRAGRFVLPGPRRVVKSSAYVFGLLDALLASLEWSDAEAIFNYSDHPAEPLHRLVNAVENEFGVRHFVPRVPLGLALAAARVFERVLPGCSPVSSVRVRKAATSTHVVPRFLLERGWRFPYTFARALADWRLRAPGDFGERGPTPIHSLADSERWRQARRPRLAG
jgi:nucleoside-diphosphate-sugar epimerase